MADFFHALKFLYLQEYINKICSELTTFAVESPTGCINLPEEVLNYMNKNHAASDSLYVLPVQDGNYIYESNEEGHPLKVHYGNKPTNMTEKHYGIEVNLPLKYNEGY